MNNYYLVIISIFLITIIIAYLFGLNLINKLEHKFNNIKINIPQQEVVVKYPEQKIENFENKINIIESKIYESKEKNTILETDKIDPVLDKDFYNNSNLNIEGFEKSKKNNQQSWENPLKSSHICYKNHKHHKCNLGTMNYADPKDMASMDYNIFFLTYPSNMTLQDYVHWLWCYNGKEYQLTYNHLKNLEKLKNNEPLIEEKGVLPPPGYEKQPLTSEEYFNKMYAVNNEFNLASSLNSQTGPMLGANYDEYSEFSQNKDLYGSSSYMRNCDVDKKKNANQLNNFVFPKDSNNLEINKEYNIYRHKKVEL